MEETAEYQVTGNEPLKQMAGGYRGFPNEKIQRKIQRCPSDVVRRTVKLSWQMWRARTERPLQARLWEHALPLPSRFSRSSPLYPACISRCAHPTLDHHLTALTPLFIRFSASHPAFLFIPCPRPTPISPFPSPSAAPPSIFLFSCSPPSVFCTACRPRIHPSRRSPRGNRPLPRAESLAHLPPWRLLLRPRRRWKVCPERRLRRLRRRHRHRVCHPAWMWMHRNLRRPRMLPCRLRHRPRRPPLQPALPISRLDLWMATPSLKMPMMTRLLMLQLARRVPLYMAVTKKRIRMMRKSWSRPSLFGPTVPRWMSSCLVPGMVGCPSKCIMKEVSNHSFRVYDTRVLYGCERSVVCDCVSGNWPIFEYLTHADLLNCINLYFVFFLPSR